MVAQLKTETKSLYDSDYNLWIIETVKQLENRDFNSVDWDNLIEEVLGLSRSDKRKLESLLMRLIEYLLILHYWDSERERNKGHWEREIANFRKQIRKELKASPSLKRYLIEIYSESYEDGRDLASKHSQLPIHTFPEKTIASLEQILDENWLP
jgi:PAS domain-containing protein